MLVSSRHSATRKGCRAALCITSAIIVQLFTAAAFFMSPAWGQTTFGTFVGTVRDPSGAAITTAVVKAVNTGTSATRSTLTDGTGGYTLVNMEPGDYQITIEAPGFQVA